MLWALVAKGQEAKKPHIILIMTDQQRGDCIGVKNPAVQTPHLDALAGEGVYFNHAYSSTPSSTPARAALLTGMSPWHHGMLGYGRVAAGYEFEMPQMLRRLGYYTFGIGKMHWFPQKTLHGFHATLVDESGRVETEGFVSDYRSWFSLQAPGENPDALGIGWNDHRAGVYPLEERLHPTAWTGRTAVEFIHNYRLEQPLFLKVSFARPHSPYDPPARLLARYDGVEIPAPAVGTWAGEFAAYPAKADAAFGDFGAAHALESRRHYYAAITFIDEQVGEIVRALKERGMYEDALILFVSDHGDMLGDHHHWRKTYAYEGSTHVPFFVKWPGWLFGGAASGMGPGVPGGASLNQPVEIRDILPTFLDAAGAEVPEKMDGASVLTLIRDPKAPWREYIDLEHAVAYEDKNHWCALTNGRTKYIWFFRTGREQLFDLEGDPGELTDLAALRRHRKTLEKWRARMVEHLSERGEAFVKEGVLQLLPHNVLYSPHYPRGPRDGDGN